MAVGGRRRLGVADRVPAGVVEILVEAGQDDGAVRQAGDRLQQLRGRRDRAGRAGGDDRARRRPRRRAARASARISVSRRADGIDAAVLGEMRRPVLGDDLQEIEGDAGNSRRDPPARGRAIAVPADAGGLHVVDQPGEIAGKPRRVGGGAGNEQRLVGRERERMRGGRRAPQASVRRGQRELAREARDRRRQGKAIGAGLDGRVEEMILLVDVADRADDRQDRRRRRRAARSASSRSARTARRVGRRIGDVGERQRIVAGDRAPGGRRAARRRGRQERRAGRNGEDARALRPIGHRRQAALSAIDSSASPIASGVPTWSQRPSMRTPKRRPASIAGRRGG